jgi:hypothetical protein
MLVGERLKKDFWNKTSLPPRETERALFAAHKAVYPAGESPVIGIGCLPI